MAVVEFLRRSLRYLYGALLLMTIPDEWFHAEMVVQGISQPSIWRSRQDYMGGALLYRASFTRALHYFQ